MSVLSSGSRARSRWFRWPVPVTVACVALAAAGCGGPSGSRGGGPPSGVPVVASTDVYGDIAERIGGAEASVTSLISDPDQDPHSYEADAHGRLALSRAKIVVENGGGYDDFVDRMLASDDRSPQVINAVAVSGRKAPAGGELNEHVWYDFPAMARLADRIAAALTRADPGHAAAFRRNAAGFKAGLTALEKKEARIRAGHRGAGVAVTEPVPLYMTAASGLVNRTPEDFSKAVEEGDDVAPKVLRDTLALFGAGKVEVLVLNAQTSGPQTQQVERAARAAKVPVVRVTETLPAGKDYLGWMNGNVDALAAALSGTTTPPGAAQGTRS